MLSRYSDNSVAAVGVVNQLMNLVFLLFEVISLGTSILCSQYFGAGRKDKVVQVVGISLIFNLISGLIFSGCLYLSADDMLLENGRALNFFGVNALRSAGDIYFPVIVGIIVMWAVFALDENIRGLIFLRRWNSFKWVGKSFVKER